jgi:Phytanoyl-CoA dioxygenase (PhyH)
MIQDLPQGGVAFMREGLPASIVSALSLAADVVYGRAEEGPPQMRASLEEWSGVQMDVAIDFLKVIDPWMHDLLHGMLVSRPQKMRVLLNYSFFRQMTPAAAVQVPWHCDAEAASTMLVEGFETLVTAWVPLSFVGVQVPSLEIAEGSNIIMRQQDLVARNHRPEPDLSGCTVATPVMAPGDLILFDQFTLHRTQPIAVQRLRRTCELRFHVV